MRTTTPMFILVCLNVCAWACSSGKEFHASGGDEAETSTAILRQAEPSGFTAFIDEFCAGDAVRGHVPSDVAFIARVKALPAADVAAYPIQVLADTGLYSCWMTAAEIVGFAGSEADVERLLGHFEAADLRRWKFDDSTSALNASILHASARVGLALAAARLGEAHPLSIRIVAHLRACIDEQYWAQPQHQVPIEHDWHPGMRRADVLFGYRYNEAIQCLASLGDVGSHRAAAAIVAVYSEARTMAFWSDDPTGERPLVRFEKALARNERIRQLGIDAYVQQFGRDF